jgi:hypothetical protein
MESKDRERILERIRKMLAMAEGQGNVNEAATAAAMAEKTMRHYQISEAEVLVEQLDKGDVEDVWVDNGTRSMPTWVDWIAVGVARAVECEVTRGRGSHRFYGVGGDAYVAAEMMKYLVKEVHRLAKKFPGDRGERGSFRRGAGSALQDRLEALGRERKEEFQQTSSGKDLIVVKQQLIVAAHGKFSYTTGGERREQYGYHQGREAGGNINLSKQIGGQQQQRKLA